MPHPTRILLADDSAVIRRLLAEAISADPELEVALAVRNGEQAVAKYSSARPDVVLLDVEMPVMNGIQAAGEIRRLDPHVPIIMFSALTVKGGEATLDALSRGASDYVAKPSGVGHVGEALRYIRGELLQKIKQWGARRRQQRVPAAPVVRPLVAATASFPEHTQPADILAIGASTGGPNALTQLMTELPADFPLPVVITQHMPPVFTTSFAERLDRTCPLRVREGTEGAVVRPGEAWVAPGDYHMRVVSAGTDRVLTLSQDAPEHSCRPAVDVMFRSVAQVYGPHILAVVLTGMGYDGADGCHAIRELGGTVIAQDEATSAVWGMPRAVVDAGLAQHVLPLGAIAKEICSSIRPGQLVGAR